MQTITVLIPVYNNASTIRQLCDAVQTAIRSYPSFECKVLLADDASTDGSFRIISELKEKYSNISLLQLSYNHTQQYAFYAAIQYVKTDYLMYLSADMQEEPEMIEKYMEAIRQHPSADLLIGFRRQNNDFLIFRILSRLFYTLIRLKVPDMPVGGFDTGCIRRDVLERFIRMFKRRDLVQAVLVACASDIHLIPYVRQKSSSDGIKIRSLVFKIKYFILSLISVYSRRKNPESVYFSVKKYIP